MIKADQLKQYLTEAARMKSDKVIKRIKVGQRISKRAHLSYGIDDLTVDKYLGDFGETTIPVGPIYRKMVTSPSTIHSLFHKEQTVPFSRVVHAGAGECLEKAILVQLAAQRNYDSFLINGALREHQEGFVEHHGFNIIFIGDKPHLIDAQNPIQNGNGTKPYVAPITSLLLGSEDLVVEKEWEQNRIYSLH